jgi:hypothetical protein
MSHRRRLSFTEKRRARLAMKWDRLEKLEQKNSITEPISFGTVDLRWDRRQHVLLQHQFATAR